MPDRFFVDKPITGERALLEGPEAHHLLHVLRAKSGDEVVLFDDSGTEFAARVEIVGRTTAELAVLARTVVDRELAIEITVGAALPKGDRQKWLVEKLTELGVARLVPIETRRGVAQPIDAAIERLRRSVVEACKQCGRNRLMKIDTPQSIERFLTLADSRRPRLFAHPGGADLREEFERVRCATGSASAAAGQQSTGTASGTRKYTGTASGIRRSVAIAIGPEGGFTDDEAALAVAAGWRSVDLGPRILRVETAALALAVIAGLLAR